MKIIIAFIVYKSNYANTFENIKNSTTLFELVKSYG